MTSEFGSLSPINFFQIAGECHRLPKKEGKTAFRLHPKNRKKYLLPDSSPLTGEQIFAELFIGWDTEGLELQVEVNSPLHKTEFPSAKSDSVEIFIDTRDVKTSGFNTRFCHHFLFLPEAMDSYHARELTHFRTDDRHELADPAEFLVKIETQRRSAAPGYTLNCWISKAALHGFDPDQFDRIGFTYRINRLGAPSQHFSVCSSDYALEQQPSLWSSLKLIP